MEQCAEVMIATTSHDLRTPINSIKNMLLMIEEDIVSTQGKKYLKVAKKSTDFMAQLISDTLDYF